jgi:hypothetical protein
MERPFQRAMARMLTDDTLRRAVFEGAAYPGLRAAERRRLAAFDRERVEIFAELLLQNRIDKAAGVLPWTVRLLDERKDDIAAEFNRTSPPRSSKPYREALDLARWILARCDQEPLGPPYLRDVVTFELAVLEMRFAFDGRYGRRRGSLPWPARSDDSSWKALIPYPLRHHRVLELGYDIEAIVEALSQGKRVEAMPQLMTVLLHVEPSGELGRFELGRATAAFLAACDGHVRIDRILSGMARRARLRGPALAELEHGAYAMCDELGRRQVLGFLSGSRGRGG